MNSFVASILSGSNVRDKIKKKCLPFFSSLYDLIVTIRKEYGNFGIGRAAHVLGNFYLENRCGALVKRGIYVSHMSSQSMILQDVFSGEGRRIGICPCLDRFHD